MTTEDGSPIYEPGDVVYGSDPFHGEQYTALSLTTRSWLDGSIEIPEAEWSEGGAPETSRIVPWRGVSSRSIARTSATGRDGSIARSWRRLSMRSSDA